MPSQKGNILLIIAIAFALVFVAGASFFAGNKYFALQNKIDSKIQKEFSPTTSSTDETGNWTPYDLKVVSLRLPLNLIVSKSNVQVPPTQYTVISFVAQTSDYFYQSKELGLASAGTLKSGQKFEIYAQDFVKTSKDHPNANTPQSIEDDMMQSNPPQGDSPNKSSNCEIEQKVGERFWVCYITAAELNNTGTWFARVYSGSYEYYVSLQATTGEKVSSKALFDQILSTFKFLDSPQGANQNPNAKLYTSQKLGVSFYYATKYYNPGETVVVNEVGDKIYVTPSSYPDYTQGQWVQVYSKDPKQTLTDAINQKILSNYSKTDCLVTSPQTERYPGKNSYPSSYEIKQITVPASPGDDMSTLSPKWSKCPEPYVTENGISYFLEDSNHPDKYVYLSIGQYGIESGLGGQSMWPDTIKFL